MTIPHDVRAVHAVFTIFIFSMLAVVAVRPEQLVAESDGKYIVVLKESHEDPELSISEMEKKHGVIADKKYTKVLRGFSANMSTVKMMRMKMDTRVLFISEDRSVSIATKPSDVGNKSSSNSQLNTNQQSTGTQTEGSVPPSQGIIHREQSSDGKETLESDAVGGVKGKPNKPSATSSPVVIPAQPEQLIPAGIKRINADKITNTGSGVGIAVLDTGIDLSHPDLVQNLGTSSKSCVSGTPSAQDDNGHGTHVAGTISAVNNAIGVVGVAPDTKLYAVKVLDSRGSGTWSSIICGIDWITANAKSLNIKVVNMSLGGPGTSDNACGMLNGDALHRAICNSTAQGITYVVAGGNSSQNSSSYVPASYEDTVITVSALVDTDGMFGGFGSATSFGYDDTFASFSNYGQDVDLGAPGVNVLSTWTGGTYNTLNGTSMASPHVAGAAALYLRNHPTSTWHQVKNALQYFGEPLLRGHFDPSNVHPEPVVSAVLP